MGGERSYSPIKFWLYRLVVFPLLSLLYSSNMFILIYYCRTICWTNFPISAMMCKIDFKFSIFTIIMSISVYYRMVQDRWKGEHIQYIYLELKRTKSVYSVFLCLHHLVNHYTVQFSTFSFSGYWLIYSLNILIIENANAIIANRFSLQHSIITIIFWLYIFHLKS